MPDELTIGIRCTNLPGSTIGDRQSVRLGIQKGDVVECDVPTDSVEVTFTAVLRLKINADGSVNFLGPYAHGTPKERFIYLCWGQRWGSMWSGVGRTKLQLATIPTAMLNTAIERGLPLTCYLNMRDDKGNPIYASVKTKQLRWDLQEG